MHEPFVYQWHSVTFFHKTLFRRAVPWICGAKIFEFFEKKSGNQKTKKTATKVR